MLPKYHILVGAIISVLLYLLSNLTPFQASIIFLASLLIDIDHYLFYVFRKKDINPVKSVRFFYKRRMWLSSLSLSERRKYRNPLMIFHGFEFLVFIGILSFFNILFFWVLLGAIIHLILDLAESAYLGYPLYLRLSQIYTYFKEKERTGFFDFDD